MIRDNESRDTEVTEVTCQYQELFDKLYMIDKMKYNISLDKDIQSQSWPTKTMSKNVLFDFCRERHLSRDAQRDRELCGGVPFALQCVQ